MAHATFDRPAHVQLPSMTRLDLTGSGSPDALLPLSPDATIDEIVAGIHSTGAAQVELLVPNNTKVLQSLAGCELLKESVATAGLDITIFTADEMIIRYAARAGLDVIAVGSSILPDKRPVTFRAKPLSALEAAPLPPPTRSTPSEPLRTVATTPRVVTTPAVQQAPAPVVPDEAFLAGLRAFEQAQSQEQLTPGETVETPEGSLLFDAPGDRGVPRSGQRAAWNAAFDDMDATIASEPAPQPVRRRDASVAPVQSKQPLGSKSNSLRWPFQRRASATRSAETAVRRLQGDSLRQPPQTTPKSATPERSRMLLPLVALAATAIAVIAWFGLGVLRNGFGAQQISLTPPVPSSEVQAFTDLEVPLASVPAAGALQGRVLEQPVRVLVQGQAISSTLVPIGRATGTLVLRNRGSFAVTVRAGQVVQAANGTSFTVDNEVTVPAATERPDGSGTIYGQGVAELTATVPGAAGNIEAGSIAGIPGVEATVRVEQGPFTGGSDQEVRIVRTDDVNRVLPQAIADLAGTATQALTAAIGQDATLVLANESITPNAESLRNLSGIEVAVFPPIGSVSSDGSFQVEVRGVFRAMAGPADQPVADQLTRVVRDQLLSTGRIGEDAQVNIVGWRSGGPGLLVDANIQPSGNTVALSTSFLDEVQKQIAGRSRVDAEAFLQTLVAENKIGGYTTLPESWESVPEKVVVKAEQQQ